MKGEKEMSKKKGLVRSLISNRRQRRGQDPESGVTLIELGIVIGIIALIALGVLIALVVTQTQGDISRAEGDIANVRSAVTRWAAGQPLYINHTTMLPTTGGGQTTVMINVGLKTWDQVAGLLPVNLKQFAPAGSMSATLMGANPWGGDYNISTTATAPDRYTLELTGVPEDLIDTLVRQIRTGGGNPMGDTANMKIQIVYDQ